MVVVIFMELLAEGNAGLRITGVHASSAISWSLCKWPSKWPEAARAEARWRWSGGVAGAAAAAFFDAGSFNFCPTF